MDLFFSRDRNSPIQCRALFLNLIETILLFTFEFLVCYNLEQPTQSESRLSWIVCFLPLILLSIISVFAYVWLLRHGRSWEVTNSVHSVCEPSLSSRIPDPSPVRREYSSIHFFRSKIRQ